MTHSTVVPFEPHDIASPGTAGTARLRRWSSVALGGGGIVTIVLNVAFTPFMTPGAPFAEAAASPAAGSVVLGAGWVWLARDLYRDSAQPGHR